MGKTLPPFSQLIEAERRRWMPFKKALPKANRSIFNRLLDCPKLHVQAGVMVSRPWPFETVVMAILLEQHTQVEQLERLEALEGRDDASQPPPILGDEAVAWRRVYTDARGGVFGFQPLHGAAAVQDAAAYGSCTQADAEEGDAPHGAGQHGGRVLPVEPGQPVPEPLIGARRGEQAPAEKPALSRVSSTAVRRPFPPLSRRSAGARGWRMAGWTASPSRPPKPCSNGASMGSPDGSSGSRITARVSETQMLEPGRPAGGVHSDGRRPRAGAQPPPNDGIRPTALSGYPRDLTPDFP
jgi:hypothetical protein